MTNEPDSPDLPKNISIRASPVMASRLDYLKQRLDTTNQSEIFRRALEIYQGILEADLVYIEKDGQRRSILP